MDSFSLKKEEITKGLKTTALLTACLIPFALTPVKEDDKWIISLAQQPEILWLNLLIAFLSLYLAYFTVSYYKDKPQYTQKLISGTLIIIMLFGTMHLGLTKMPQWKADQLYKPQNYDILSDFSFPDEMKNYRMDTYNCYDNLGLFTGVPCLQFFNSTVTPSIMEFYPEVGVKRDVSSKPSRDMYALRSLLSVKYLVMPNWEVENFTQERTVDGLKQIKDSYPYTVFENTNFISMGFAYDRYTTYDDLDSINTSHRSNLLVRAIAIDEKLIEKYNLPLEKLEIEDIYDYTYKSFITDVTKRKNMSSWYFEQTSDGFQCKIILNQPNLVFFSVPYDKGFTAYVNGEKAEIEKVNYGLSAVYVPQGESTIEFVYHTPYLTQGAILTAMGWLAYGAYLIFIKKKNI